jgi:release factor glutamine methyltransferase
MKIKDIVKKYSKQLKTITHIPQKEVEIMILHIVQQNPIWLHLNYNEEFKFENKLKPMVDKRATDYPLEYITNKVTFYGEQFSIYDGVLIPRPETEILVEKAIDILRDIPNPKVLEVGIGSGVISIMLAKEIPNIKIIGVDINQKAIDLANKNKKYHQVEDKIDFIYSDLFENIQDDDFDMIISNPPYIQNSYKLPKNVSYEPKEALFGGTVGDEILKTIIDKFISIETKYLLCEIGYDQKKPLNNYIQNSSSNINIEFYQDYSKFDRGFIAIKKGNL